MGHDGEHRDVSRGRVQDERDRASVGVVAGQGGDPGAVGLGPRCLRGDILPAADVASQYKVSVRVTCNALAMLAANRYVSRPGAFRSYRVTWQAGA
jgi:hypothetical protein